MSATVASAMVAALVKKLGPSEIGRRVGAALQGVKAHASAKAKPRPEVRERYRRHYGIAPEDWERPAEDSAMASPEGAGRRPQPSPPIPPSGPTNALECASKVIATTHQREIVADVFENVFSRHPEVGPALADFAQELAGLADVLAEPRE